MDAGRGRERRAAHRQGEREQYEARLRCKDGGAGWVIIRDSVIEENGEYAGTFSLMTDITSDDLDFLYALDGDPDVIRWTNLDGKRAPYAFYRDVLLPRSLAYYDKYPGYGYRGVAGLGPQRLSGTGNGARHGDGPGGKPRLSPRHGEGRSALRPRLHP